MIVFSDSRVFKEHAAAAIRLKAVLVRVHNDRVGVMHQRIRGSSLLIEIGSQFEIATIGRVDMYAKVISTLQIENLRERVDRATAGGTKCNHYRTDIAGS